MLHIGAVRAGPDVHVLVPEPMCCLSRKKELVYRSEEEKGFGFPGAESQSLQRGGEAGGGGL